MKIEKVNDNQIRCTLTKADLADRQLKLSELAYGTEKAKGLFRDMMQQAAYEFGFEAEDIPLMIEAIPLSSECIILIITKVEYPEELDTRFSKFAPSSYEDEEEDYDDVLDEDEDSREEVLDLFKKLKEDNSGDDALRKFVPLTDAISKAEAAADQSKKNTIGRSIDFAALITKLYEFDSLETVAAAAATLSSFYTGPNSLYKDDHTDTYVLLVTIGEHTPTDYNKVCNILSEYASARKCSESAVAYMNEHYDVILRNNALQTIKDMF